MMTRQLSGLCSDILDVVKRSVYSVIKTQDNIFYVESIAYLEHFCGLCKLHDEKYVQLACKKHLL